MAEALLRARSEREGLDIHVESAGLAANEGETSSQGAINAMNARGLDISAHRASNVTKAQLERADAIYTMTQRHAEYLKNAYPQLASRISVLGNGIPDPFGLPDAAYEECADELEKQINKTGDSNVHDQKS